MSELYMLYNEWTLSIGDSDQPVECVVEKKNMSNGPNLMSEWGQWTKKIAQFFFIYKNLLQINISIL